MVDETTTPMTVAVPEVTVAFGSQEAFVAIGPAQSSYQLLDSAVAKFQLTAEQAANYVLVPEGASLSAQPGS